MENPQFPCRIEITFLVRVMPIHPEREICSEPMSLYETLDRLQNVGAVPSEAHHIILYHVMLGVTVRTQNSEIAKNHRISNFERIDLQPSTMRSFLAKGHPILIAIQSDSIFSKFFWFQPLCISC